MQRKKLVKYIIFFSILFLTLFFSVVIIIYLSLFLEVRKICNRSINIHNDNCINSLLKTLESGSSSVKEKNDAIWALGQIADEKALTSLRIIYTGKIPEKEPLEMVISQYEIKKAIHWIEDGNWTSWMYFAYR